MSAFMLPQLYAIQSSGLQTGDQGSGHAERKTDRRQSSQANAAIERDCCQAAMHRSARPSKNAFELIRISQGR